MATFAYPKQTGWVKAGGSHPTFLNEAEPWDASDPFVKDNPDLFDDTPTVDPRRSVPVVEQATAAPGETRDVAAPDELGALRIAYKNVTGETPDKRWGADRLRQEIENAGG